MEKYKLEGNDLYMDNRREKFMNGIDARGHVQQCNDMNPKRPNSNQKKNIKNKPTTLQEHFKRNINRYKALALAVLATVTTLVGARHVNNAQIDTVHNAYTYTDSLDRRAVNSEEYDRYIGRMEALDLIFKDSDKGKFHDIIRKLELEDKVLDSKQITNLALEIFKIGFGEKNNVDPTQIKISYSAPDIENIR